ncbi:MAG TPA: hypothetical protein VH744_14950 [Terriglobales bacterium]|jgi:hypothetical protein
MQLAIQIGYERPQALDFSPLVSIEELVGMGYLKHFPVTLPRSRGGVERVVLSHCCADACGGKTQ